MKFYTKLVLTSLLMGSIASGMEPQNQPKSLIEEIQTDNYEPTRDLEAISNIFKHDWPNLFVGRPFDQSIVDRLMIVNPTDNPDVIKKFLKVARHNDKTIGFATYYLVKNRPGPQDIEGYLEVGALAPEYRSKGIARHFFPKILDELMGMDISYLTVFVRKDNVIAKSLYEKNGLGDPKEAIGGKAYQLFKRIKPEQK